MAAGHARIKLRFARTQRDLGRRGVARCKAQEARDVLLTQLGPDHPLAADAARLVTELKRTPQPQPEVPPAPPCHSPPRTPSPPPAYPRHPAPSPSSAAEPASPHQPRLTTLPRLSVSASRLGASVRSRIAR